MEKIHLALAKIYRFYKMKIYHKIETNKMKNLKNNITLIFLFIVNFAFACDACKLQQPKVTQGFTHGTGPESKWDWLIVAIIAVITVYTLIYSIKYIVKPGEKDKNHIKYSILN